MKVYVLTFRQDIPAAVEVVWNFFSSPLNLAKITPPEMTFRVTSQLDEEQQMYPGMIISYKISPFGGFHTSWLTEITHVEPRRYFVDEQRSGPFAFWHHQHHLREINGGVRMTDILHYAIPLGPIGQLVNSLLVQQRLKQIFEYRRLRIKETFGSFDDQPSR